MRLLASPVWRGLQIGDQSIQDPDGSSSELVACVKFLRIYISAVSRLAETLKYLAFRASCDDGKSRKFAMVFAAEAFCEIAGCGGRGVHQVVVKPEITLYGRPLTVIMYESAKLYRKLPRQEIFELRCVFHVGRTSNRTAAGRRTKLTEFRPASKIGARFLRLGVAEASSFSAVTPHTSPFTSDPLLCCPHGQSEETRAAT